MRGDKRLLLSNDRRRINETDAIGQQDIILNKIKAVNKDKPLRLYSLTV